MEKQQNKEINEFLKKNYEYGFETDIESETLPPGINEDVIRIISEKKKEPEFLEEQIRNKPPVEDGEKE